MKASVDPKNKIELPGDRDWYFMRTGIRLQDDAALPEKPWSLGRYPLNSRAGGPKNRAWKAI